MHILADILGVCLVAVALLEGFETIVMPRTSTRAVRLTRYVYRDGWILWRRLSATISSSRRESFLSVFGPLSLIVLLILWGLMFIFGFGMLQWAQGNSFVPHGSLRSFGSALYFSGVTLSTLGFGDITPVSGFSRALAVIESGIGLGLLALVVGYLPTLYQSFSRREIVISMLDSRAGSPPSASEILRRYAETDNYGALEQFLKDWEVWSADLLESHLSYPVLAYYRSQHDRQSWISALTAVMDTCALIMSDIVPGPIAQARQTFAMGRHAIVDLSIIFGITPSPPDPDRLVEADWTIMCSRLSGAGLRKLSTAEIDETRLRLRLLRSGYEPLLNGLADRFLMPLPPWTYVDRTLDNWESDPWSLGGMSHLN